MEICSSYRCVQLYSGQNSFPTVQCCSAKQVGCDPAPMHCSSVQGKMQSPLFSAALQKSSQQAVCHCKYTYGDLLFVQVCRDPAPMHCSTAQGKMQSTLLSAAMQIRLAAGLCLWENTYGDVLFRQVGREPTAMHCSTAQGKVKSHCSVLQCKTGWQQACVTANRPVKVCSSYRSAVTQLQCTAQGKIQSPLLSAATQIRLTPGLCHCKHPYGDVLFIQVCSDPTPMHCSTAQGKVQSPLLSAAMQIRLTPGLCLWKNTYGDVHSNRWAGT